MGVKEEVEGLVVSEAGELGEGLLLLGGMESSFCVVGLIEPGKLLVWLLGEDPGCWSICSAFGGFDFGPGLAGPGEVSGSDLMTLAIEPGKDSACLGS